MSVTAKRNNNEYTNMEIVQRAIVQKANILFEFSKKDDKFNMSVFDPLGCVWANSSDVTTAVNNAFDRLQYLRTITRQQTIISQILVIILYVVGILI